VEYKGSPDTSYEPFTTGMTGLLTSFVAQDGLRYTLEKPYMKVVKGQHFVLAISRKKGTCRLIRIVAPDPHIHS
jgi:hypothetical protein